MLCSHQLHTPQYAKYKKSRNINIVINYVYRISMKAFSHECFLFFLIFRIWIWLEKIFQRALSSRPHHILCAIFRSSRSCIACGIDTQCRMHIVHIWNSVCNVHAKSYALENLCKCKCMCAYILASLVIVYTVRWGDTIA